MAQETEVGGVLSREAKSSVSVAARAAPTELTVTSHLALLTTRSALAENFVMLIDNEVSARQGPRGC